MGFEKLRTSLWMEGQALKETNNKANSVGTGELKVGRWGELTVDFDDFLQQNCDGANTVP